MRKAISFGFLQKNLAGFLFENFLSGFLVYNNISYKFTQNKSQQAKVPAKSGSLANKRQARSSLVRASDLSCSDPSEWSKLHSERAMLNLPKLSLQASQVSSKPSKGASKTKQACQKASQANQASQAQVKPG